MTYLSNSRKQELHKHSEAVAKIAVALAEYNHVTDQRILNSIFIAAYLHDSGKVIKFFQDYMIEKSNETGYPTSEQKVSAYEQYGKLKGVRADMLLKYPRHHEVSWAFASAYLDFYDGSAQDILYAVYYHHPQPVTIDGKYFTTDQAILGALTTEDHHNVREWLITCMNHLVEKGYHIELKDNEDDGVVGVPKLFMEENRNHDSNNNAKNLVIRFCVSCADRLVSSLSPVELDSFLAEKLPASLYATGIINIPHTPRSGAYTFVVPESDDFDMNRYAIQKDVVDKMTRDDVTNTFVKAPAGFGKSKIALMFALETLRKGANQVFIIAPRNTIISSITDTLAAEMKIHKVTGVSLESYFAGERQYTNKPDSSIPEFASNIVVTNIDNLLNPSFSRTHASQFQAMLSSPVIFDEFHEFFMDHEALLASLTIFMRARTRICGGIKSLFLSATPISLNILWDTDKIRTFELPNDSEHYPAMHKKPYNFAITSDIPDSIEPNTVVMVNSISTSQNIFANMDAAERKNGFLAHSKFRTAKLKEVKESIFTLFGKGNAGNAKIERVISARLLQASVNVSFQKLVHTTMSIQSFVQALGRVNRFGEYSASNVTYAQLPKDHAYYSSDICAAGIGTPLEIIRLWEKHFCALINKRPTLTLDELYREYNTFQSNNKACILKAIKEWYSHSVNTLSTRFTLTLCKVKAAKVVNTSQADKIIKICKPKFGLRECGGYFYTIQDKSGKWLPIEDVRSAKTFEFEKLFTISDKEYGSRYTKAVIKSLIAAGYEDFSIVEESLKISDLTGIKVFKNFARTNTTPFPIFHITYDDILGDIKK